MTTSTLICPRCDARIAVTLGKFFFTVHCDSPDRPTELRVMEDGDVRHACDLSIDRWIQHAGCYA